ncbi:16S rRNA (guanine(527)-N(7))-methyltransferase RsmG [Pikeienuella sp. HZG-20]|uniref:16S rRNA (guanine(527)-N(7))-methyltransferase RsmG n=1 Tax=Paludibacillus litoralis TaxID=3133267 RepID=UPI0030ECCE17
MTVEIGAGLRVSRETFERFEVYAQLLARWNKKINLVSAATIKDLWTRHIVDCAQIERLAPSDAKTWVDLGSGAGLPGLLVAAIRHEAAQPIRMHLIDSDSRKAAFIAEAARAMGISVSIDTNRLGAHETNPQQRETFDVVSARALAPLPRLLEYAEPFIGPSTICLFPKGKARESEIMAATQAFHMNMDEIPSITDGEGAILRIKELSRVRAF